MFSIWIRAECRRITPYFVLELSILIHEESTHVDRAREHNEHHSGHKHDEQRGDTTLASLFWGMSHGRSLRADTLGQATMRR